MDALEAGMRLGELHWMLDMEVYGDRDAGSIYLSQRAH